MAAIPVNYETVLQIVYQLSARQRFTLLHDVLKSLEVTPAVDLPIAAAHAPNKEMIQPWRDELAPKYDFWANQSIRELAQSQGVAPVKNIDELCAVAWPDDESTDEFLTTIRSWREFDAPTHPMIEQE